MRNRLCDMTGMIQEFIDYIDQSPSAFHAAAQVRQILVEAGFASLSGGEQHVAAPGGYVFEQEGAVIAWWVPAGIEPNKPTSFRIIGSHTDSPGFMVKPEPDIVCEGMRQIGVEIYGGPILQSWFDRDLAFAGRVVDARGGQHLVRTDAVARIPNLAIHLYRSDVPPVEKQAHTQPLSALKGDFLTHIAELSGVDIEHIYAHELISADTQRGQLLGEYLAAGRLDNLTSVWASLQALLAAKAEATDILVFAAFNHEEVGSSSRTGAAGPMLERTLSAIATELNQDAGIYDRSVLISADAAHGVHPNYAAKHDPTHRPMINAGPVLKRNANQRYASDARSEATWVRACRDAGIPHQIFVGNNDVPCGSTIGPAIATRLGIPTVDVGIPLLSMHSARELCGVNDMQWFIQALAAFYSQHPTKAY